MQLQISRFNAPSVEKVTGITVDGKQYADKYLFNGESPVIEDGRLAIAGIVVGRQYDVTAKRVA